jgi:hypothetical protein
MPQHHSILHWACRSGYKNPIPCTSDARAKSSTMKFLPGGVILPLLLSVSLAQTVPHTRTYHYIGGHYIPSPANSSEHLHVGQIYIEHLSPYPLPNKTLPAILLLHGNAQTGTVCSRYLSLLSPRSPCQPVGAELAQHPRPTPGLGRVLPPLRARGAYP